jgi:hypothetical protein
MVFPNSWDGFVSWHQTQGGERWKDSGLEKRFALPWGRRLNEVLDDEQIVVAVTDNAEDEEDAINVSDIVRYELRSFIYRK